MRYEKQTLEVNNKQQSVTSSAEFQRFIFTKNLLEAYREGQQQTINNKLQTINCKQRPINHTPHTPFFTPILLTTINQ